MAFASDHLDNLIREKRGSANVQVVSVDIVKYSKRKSTVQSDVIASFTKLLRLALVKTAQQFTDYAQANDVNFDRDVIKLPTGDGVIVVFTFEGLQDAHLQFAQILLEVLHEHNGTSVCPTYDNDGWCNCHNKFAVRIGVSDGKGILYHDVNENYNVAGTAVNLAARVMDSADGMQVLFTQGAYENLIDMTTDTGLETSFQVYEGVKVKHGLEMDIYQYCPAGSDFISGAAPDRLSLGQKMDTILEAQQNMMTNMLSPQELKPEQLHGIMDQYANILNVMNNAVEHPGRLVAMPPPLQATPPVLMQEIVGDGDDGPETETI